MYLHDHENAPYTLISELKMTLYKRESLGFLLVLIEMRPYFLKTI